MLRRSLRFIRAGCIAAVLALLSASASSWASTYNLSYDELGRLVGVVDGGGNTATYNYDALGNILSITRGNGAVSIVSFSPHSGPVGATVTISGYGFSATPSQNTVAFNGTAANVVSSTSSQLVVTVPAGATSGAITVTTPSGSATSPSVFNVTSGLAPTISSFSPTTGVTGTALTISGTNFQANANQNNVTLNTRALPISAAATTSLSATVPRLATSGRIGVTTPLGQATSTQDFFVAPGTHTASDIAWTGRMSIGGSQTVTLSTANTVGLVLFDGTAGQRVSLVVTNSSFGNCNGGNVQILNPDGSVAGSWNLCGGAIVGPVILPATASYTIVVNPYANTTGSAALSLYNVPPDVTGTITAGGASVPLAITAPGQKGSLTFSGTASQRVSLNMAINSGNGGCWYVNVVAPDGSILAGQSNCGNGYFTGALTLPASGTYKINFVPSGAATFTTTFTLYNVPPDVTGTITAGGSPVTLTTTTPGQNGNLTFSGSASQRVSLYMAINSGNGGCWYVNVVAPDGSILNGQSNCGNSYFSGLLTLPASGTYKINFVPSGTATFTATFTLYNVPPDVTGTITAGGSPVTLATTTPGQNGNLTFSGSASQRVSLYVAINQGNGACWGVSVVNPDGSTLASQFNCGNDYYTGLLILPASGTYKINFNPYSNATLTATFTLYNVPPDATGTISINGGPASITITTPGQKGSLTFSGAASQIVSLNMSLGSGLSGGCWYLALTNPDGTNLAGQYSCSSGLTWNSLTLPAAGTYTIKFTPGGMITGTATFTVTSP